MPHYAALRDYDFTLEADDIRGAILEDRSGNEIGTVMDAIIEHETGEIRYLVAAVSGREILVPAERVLPSSTEDTLRTDLTRGEAERLPTSQESGVLQERHSGEATRNREDRAKSAYKKEYEEGAVAHRGGSDRLITPEPDEMPAGRGNDDIDSSTMTPSRIADKFGGVGQPITAPTGIPRGSGGSSDVGTSGNFERRHEERDMPAISRGRRWDRFSQSLRDRHLSRMREGCDVCARNRAA